eukprot:6544969-Lingulodinium_polyedra.AAC.1
MRPSRTNALHLILVHPLAPGPPASLPLARPVHQRRLILRPSVWIDPDAGVRLPAMGAMAAPAALS